MELTSWQFVAFGAAVIVAINVSANPRYRAAVLALANVVFIGSHLNAPLQLLALVALLAGGYAAVAIVRRWTHPAVVATSIAAIVFAFLYLKRYSFMSFIPELHFPYLLLGLSYILFRIIHLIVDSASGGIEKPVDVGRYFNYTCNFLTFISGPIQRFQDYRADADAARTLSADDVEAGFKRVIWGYFKMLAVSASAHAIFLKLSPALLDPAVVASPWPSAARYAATATVYTVFLYYNFSGFIDVVIGFGRLIGHRFPENFNRPFVAASFLDFWSRWHMTLSNWFRDYMFSPLLAALMSRYPSAKLAPWFGVAGFFVTFMVMGVWHGATPVFVAYGFAMGLGASLNKMWQLFMTARLGRKGYREFCKAPAYLYFCRGLTFAYFALGVTALWVDIGQLAHLGRTLGVAGVLATFAALTVLGALGLLAGDLALSGFAWVGRAFVAERRGGMRVAFALACGVLLTLAVNTLFNQPPEFVYRAF